MRDIMNLLTESQTNTAVELNEGLLDGLEEKLRELAATNPKGAEAIYWIIKILASKDTGHGKEVSDRVLARLRQIIDGAKTVLNQDGQGQAALVESFSDDDLKKLLAIAGH